MSAQNMVALAKSCDCSPSHFCRKQQLLRLVSMAPFFTPAFPQIKSWNFIEGFLVLARNVAPVSIKQIRMKEKAKVSLLAPKRSCHTLLN